MKIVKIVIERSDDGFYSAYSETGALITGGGATVQECKKDVLDSIATLKTLDKKNRPAFLDAPYKLVYHFDAQSLLDYYKKIFTKSALSELTGINQQLLYHYADGIKKPRPAQRKKIETALHELGAELLSVEL